MAERDYADDDPRNPYGTDYGAGTAPAAQRISGPVTDPHDPRLSDPSYASDPEVLKFLNGIYGQGGTAYNPPPSTPGWDPQAQAWIAPKQGGDNPGSGTAPPPTASQPPTNPANPYDSGGLVPTDGTYPGGPPPQYTPPSSYSGGSFVAPAYKAPPAYDFQTYTPTTAADLLTDPGYQVRFDRGLDAVRADKAAAGVYNGGGTARALLDYGQDSASQEFKNVDDRRLTDFNTNEANRFKSYLTNVTTQYDTPYANAYKSALDTANFGQANAQFGATYNQGNSQFAQNSNYNDWLSSYNAWRNSRNDAFSQKFQVSSF